MVNHHFGNIGDVWKHLALAEILAIERPSRYWESHAGSATYPMDDNPQRTYGIRHFMQAAPRLRSLAASRFFAHITTLNKGAQLLHYPGSAFLAMSELGASCSYMLCDSDADSVQDLRDASRRLGLDGQVDARQADGMTEIHNALTSVSAENEVMAHIDPFKPREPGPGGLSAVEVAGELIDAGIGIIDWYGYDGPGQRAWAYDELSDGRRNVWCGDVMVTSDQGDVRDDGDFGAGTTPGTGCGIVCANLSREAIDACERLGEEMATAYEDARLPDGTNGQLNFRSLKN